MTKIYLIGIGPGDPKYLTHQAVDIMKTVDLFFLHRKEERKKDFLKIRKEILETYLRGRDYRVVEMEFPEMKKSPPYEESIKKWRFKKADIITSLLENNLKEGETGAFLVWGDPSIYDGYLEILSRINKERTMDLELEVIPGITSIQALTAKHKIPLNRIGESITITTGRRLRDFAKEDVKNVVVLLDNYLTFDRFKDSELEIYWGAYIGTDEEVILSGRLKEVAGQLKKIRAELKKKMGWIMDTYILRLP